MPLILVDSDARHGLPIAVQICPLASCGRPRHVSCGSFFLPFFTAICPDLPCNLYTTRAVTIYYIMSAIQKLVIPRGVPSSMNRLASRRWMCASPVPERLSDLKSRLSSGPKLGDFLQLERSSARRVDYSGAKDLPKPKWLSIPAPSPEAAANVARLSKDVAGLNVATVCQEAKCPNLSQVCA